MRQITPETFEEFLRSIGVVFQFDPRDDEIANFKQVEEFDRMFAVVDEEAMVATFGTYSFELSTPGASVAAGGLTAVSVHPTHRRRGLLTAMIERHYEDCRQRREPLSILWASEWPIYSRFGYGQATQGAAIEIDKRHGALISGDAAGGCRMIDGVEARKLLPEIYEQVRSMPGMLSRTPQQWEHRHFYDGESWRDGYTAARFTVYEQDGQPLGYVKWRGKEDWEGGVPGSTVQVLALHSITPQAERGLWEFMLNLDLVTKIKAGRRPVDDPLLMLLADRRRLSRRIHDALWVAILDVPAALAARRYAVDGDVVIEVTGSFTPGVDGRYRLVGGRQSAECEPTEAAADVTMSASELGAMYLGGSRLGLMQRWGSAAGSPENIRLVDAMFGWDQSPWCPEVF